MNEAFVLTGTNEPELEPVHLVAGALSADLTNGNLRSIRHDGVEVLRAVAYIVRDKDWGTYDPHLSNLEIQQAEDGFLVSYDAVCLGPDGTRLRYSAQISGSVVSGLTFEATARPDTDFETNRCGFCILHPIVGLAGEPVTVEHVDGSQAETRLPALIEPWQPFKSMRAITHTVVPGLKAQCRMEGDTFEMEDQRNWSDASYKTYVRPLELPWPYVMPAGKAERQSVSLRFVGTANARQADRAGDTSVAVTLGQEGPPLPDIGVVVYPTDVPATLLQIDLLKRLAPQALLLNFDETAGHGIDALRGFAKLVAAYSVPATLECVLPCRQDTKTELAQLAALVEASGLKLDAIAVSPVVDRGSTPPGSEWPACPPLEDVYAAARQAFPDLTLGGGMYSYFTELNRKRVPAKHLDFITHCTCPIVHASDDLSVMQSLEALPFITASTRAIFGDKPYRIGPSTIAMRQNPYGSATKDNPSLSRVAMANEDPRQNGLFAAAWAAAYAARVAPAGISHLTLGSFVGPFGVVSGADEPSATGSPRPIFQIVRRLAAIAGKPSIAMNSGADEQIAGLAVRTEAGAIQCILSNLTAGNLTVDVSADGLSSLRWTVLDTIALSEHASEPRVVDASSGQLVLGPRAVAFCN